MASIEAIKISDGEIQQEGSILTFPHGVSFEPNVREEEREGKVTVFSKTKIRIAVLNYENNKLNGLSKFYENGEVNRIVTFVNGKMEGWSKEGEKEYIYVNNNKEFELVKNEKLEGYVNEINIQTEIINRCYKMNKNHKPVGVGYVFNEDEEVCKIVNFKGENEEIVIKEFKEGKMIEKDDNGNVIYEGEYLEDVYWFPRHGNGQEMIENDEVYIGNWVINHKEGEGKLFINGCLRYKGMWKNDVANGHGCLVDDEDNVICEGEWKDGVCKKYYYREINKRGCFVCGTKRKETKKKIDGELKEWLELVTKHHKKREEKERKNMRKGKFEQFLQELKPRRTLPVPKPVPKPKPKPAKPKLAAAPKPKVALAVAPPPESLLSLL